MSRACEENWELQAARLTRRLHRMNTTDAAHRWKRDRAEDDPTWTSGYDQADLNDTGRAA